MSQMGYQLSKLSDIPVYLTNTGKQWVSSEFTIIITNPVGLALSQCERSLRIHFH